MALLLFIPMIGSKIPAFWIVARFRLAATTIIREEAIIPNRSAGVSREVATTVAEMRAEEQITSAEDIQPVGAAAPVTASA